MDYIRQSKDVLKNINVLKSFYYLFNNEEIKLFCSGKSGVYMILNESNKRCYVGSAFSKTENHNRLYIRFKNHFYNSQKSSSVVIKRSPNVLSIHNFSFHIIEFTGNDFPRNRASFYLKKVCPSYNILKYADSSLGYAHTEDAKTKMRQNYFLNKGKSLSDAVKKSFLKKL